MAFFCWGILGLLFFLLLKNYHKTVLIFAPMSILFQDYFCLRYEAPALSLSFALEFMFLAFAVYNKKLTFKTFPLKNPFYLLFSMLLIGVFVSRLNILKTLPYTIDIITSYLIVLFFFHELKSFNDLKISIKSLTIVALIFVGYSIIEFILQSNPILDSIRSMLPLNWGGTLYSTTERYASIRCQSFMTISISWGAFCCILLSFIFFCSDLLKKYYGKFFYWLFVALLIFSVYTSGTRSAYVFLIIVLIGAAFALKGNTKFLYYLLLLFGAITVWNSIAEIFSSMTQSAELSGGSSYDMRSMQFDAAIKVISDSPILGFGVKGLSHALELSDDVLGAESIWLQQLISYGIVGIIIQIYLYYRYGKLLFDYTYGSYRFLALAITIGWVVFCSLTSSPGLQDPYYLILLMILYKYGSFKTPKNEVHMLSMKKL